MLVRLRLSLREHTTDRLVLITGRLDHHTVDHCCRMLGHSCAFACRLPCFRIHRGVRHFDWNIWIQRTNLIHVGPHHMASRTSFRIEKTCGCCIFFSLCSMRHHQSHHCDSQRKCAKNFHLNSLYDKYGRENHAFLSFSLTSD